MECLVNLFKNHVYSYEAIMDVYDYDLKTDAGKLAKEVFDWIELKDTNDIHIDIYGADNETQIDNFQIDIFNKELAFEFEIFFGDRVNKTTTL